MDRRRSSTVRIVDAIDVAMAAWAFLWRPEPVMIEPEEWLDAKAEEPR